MMTTTHIDGSFPLRSRYRRARAAQNVSPERRERRAPERRVRMIPVYRDLD